MEEPCPVALAFLKCTLGSRSNCNHGQPESIGAMRYTIRGVESQEDSHWKGCLNQELRAEWECPNKEAVEYLQI